VLLAGHAAGLYLVDLAPLVRKYRRAQREVTLSLDRRRRIRATSFNLNAFCSHDCLALFRFLPEHLGQLVDLLDINVSFPRTRLSVPPVECLAIVLRRLASPARWVDLEEFFGRSGSALCQIFYTTVVMMMDKWGALLTEWRMEFMRDRAALYAEKIEEAGAYLDRCVGFVDGTAIFISRPGGGLQRACYSGHKRHHAVKFQNVLIPDGLFSHLFGPWEGRRHDMTLYYESGLDVVLPDALMIGGSQNYIYGDAAYMVRPWLQAAFSGVMTDEQTACSSTMAVPRTAVEWGFKDVKQTCSALDYRRKLRLRQGPVGLLYRTAAFVWNLRCCAYGSSTSSFFDCAPPNWEQYLGLAPIVDEGVNEGGSDAGAEGADGEGGGGAGECGGGGGAPVVWGVGEGAGADGQ